MFHSGSPLAHSPTPLNPKSIPPASPPTLQGSQAAMESCGVWPAKWHGSGCFAEARVAGRCFTICGSCYRGQVYCGERCRRRMRRNGRCGVPTGNTRTARKESSITGTGNGSTGQSAVSGASALGPHRFRAHPGHQKPGKITEGKFIAPSRRHVERVGAVDALVLMLVARIGAGQ